MAGPLRHSLPGPILNPCSYCPCFCCQFLLMVVSAVPGTVPPLPSILSLPPPVLAADGPFCPDPCILIMYCIFLSSLLVVSPFNGSHWRYSVSCKLPYSYHHSPTTAFIWLYQLLTETVDSSSCCWNVLSAWMAGPFLISVQCMPLIVRLTSPLYQLMTFLLLVGLYMLRPCSWTFISFC